MSDVTNIKVVPCRAVWNGVDVGFTSGDIDVKPTEDAVKITAHQEGSNMLDKIRTGRGVAVGLKLQETSVAQVRAALANGGGGTSGGVAQITSIVCIADSSGSLNNCFFTISSKLGNKYLVWLNVNSAGTAPTLAGYTPKEVDIATSDTNSTVATKVAAVLAALSSDYASASVTGHTITVTDENEGFVNTDPSVGNSGFTITVPTPGVGNLSGMGAAKDFTSQLADSAKLYLQPVVNDSTDHSEDVAFWKAYPELGSIKLSGEHPREVDITFIIFPDTSKPKAVRLWAYGDHTA